MIFTITKTQYDRNITLDNEIDLDYDDVIELISNPIISDTKNSAPYLMPFAFYYDENGESYTIQDNAECMTVLILDIDDGLHWDDFKFEFTHFRYTSFSNTEAKNKYRIIVPIKTPITVDTLRSKYYKTWMKKKFKWNDPATIKVAGQYSPNCKTLDNYKFDYHIGKIFDFEDYRDEIMKEKSKWEKREAIKKSRREAKERAFADRPVRKPSVANNRKVLDYLEAGISPNGMGHLSFVAIAVAVACGDQDTLDAITLKMYQDSFSTEEINRAINNARR